MNNYTIKMKILDTFFYEEETIFHVENNLQSHNIVVNRAEIREFIFELLNEGLIKIFDDPSHGMISFMDANDEYIEDYWFKLTNKGLVELNKYQGK